MPENPGGKFWTTLAPEPMQQNIGYNGIRNLGARAKMIAK
jgi:hypothetical protein